MNKVLKRILIGFTTLILVLFITLAIYSRNPYTALEEMDDAIALLDNSDSTKPN